MVDIFKKVAVCAVLMVAAALTASAVEFANPLGKETELESIIDRVIGFLLGLAVVVCPTLIIWGGFMIATSGGDQEKTKTGKRIITYAVVGLVIMALAGVIKAIIYDITQTD